MARSPSQSSPTDPEPSPSSGFASIYELAEVTGVSPSTVSRVLNQRGRISEKTRRRVLDAARAAGFRPRAAVRRNTAAIVLDRMRYAGCGGFLASMLSHLVSAMARLDVVAEIYTEDNVERLGTRFIDGVLALTWDTRTLELLKDIGDLPVVLINRADIDEVSVAMTDHHQAGTMAAEYFLDRGHRKIALLSEERDWGSQSRVDGVRDALSKAGLDPDDHLYVGYTNHQLLERRLHEALHASATAIYLAGEDLTFPGTHALCTTFDRRIGKDISVIGMENEQVSRYGVAPVTALAQPMADLAQAALEMLLDGIHHNDDAPRRRVLNNRLIERASVASLDA